MLNRKEALRDTQPNLVLKPSDYWRLSLKDQVEELVQEELGTLASDHTVFTVSLRWRSSGEQYGIIANAPIHPERGTRIGGEAAL